MIHASLIWLRLPSPGEGDLFNHLFYKVMGFFGTLFIVCIILIGILGAIVAIISKASEPAFEQRKEDYLKWIDSMQSKYGEITLKIISYNYLKGLSRYFIENALKKGDDGYCISETILIFDTKSVIVIGDKGEFSYADIIDFNVNNEMSYKTSTSTGSLIGRSVVGGVLSGGVGVVIGGTTAEKTTEASVTNYKINISIRNMANPLVSVETPLELVCNTITSVLKNIIDRNENTRQSNGL